MAATDKKPMQEPEQNKPAAVPVVTPEEAKEANDEARASYLLWRKEKEPFYDLYMGQEYDVLSFEGTIKAVSQIPVPEQNDYPNCLYVLFVELDSYHSNSPADQEIACEALINVPIMKDHKIIAGNRFLPGDKIHCSCAEYDSMPQAIQEIQLVDDIQSFEHQQYYALQIEKIKDFSGKGQKSFSKREITILPIQTLPKNEKAEKERKERIQNEIKRIEDELKQHGGSFAAWKEEYKSISEKYKALQEVGYKGWINDCFFEAEGFENTYKTDVYIKGVLAYKKYLEEHNIDLIILRIPNKGDFAARVLASDTFQENPAWVEHYYECLKNDIEIVDPMPEMWKHRFDFPLFYFFYPQEEHPFEGTSFIAAKVISDVLQRYNLEKVKDTITLEETSYSQNFKQGMYFWPQGNDKYNPEDRLSFKQAIQNGKTIGGLVPCSGSTILFLSNSFFAMPDKVSGASVPAYAAYHLQSIPDWFFRTGAGNGLLRTLISNVDILSNRQAVVIVGMRNLWSQSQPPIPSYLTGSGNKKLSLEKTITDFKHDIKISGEDFYSFTTNSNGELRIEATDTSNRHYYCFELTVPSIPQKENCMVKINYTQNSYITFSVYDKQTNEIIEDNYTISLEQKSVELIIPINSLKPSRDIVIKMNPSYPDYSFLLKNIELWYY